MEERKNLLMTMANEQSGAIAKSALERAEQSQVHIDRIKIVLQSSDKGIKEDLS